MLAGRYFIIRVVKILLRYRRLFPEATYTFGQLLLVCPVKFLHSHTGFRCREISTKLRVADIDKDVTGIDTVSLFHVDCLDPADNLGGQSYGLLGHHDAGGCWRQLDHTILGGGDGAKQERQKKW